MFEYGVGVVYAVGEGVEEGVFFVDTVVHPFPGYSLGFYVSFISPCAVVVERAASRIVFGILVVEIALGQGGERYHAA